MKRDGKQQPKVVVRIFVAGVLVAEEQVNGQLVTMGKGK